MKKAIAIILSIMLVLAITIPAAAIKTIALKSIKLNSIKITLKVGQTYNLKATFTPANTTQKLLTYVTADKKIATVDKNGKITAVKAGTTVIQVVSSSNKKILAKCNVTISQPEKTGPSWTWDTSDWEINNWYVGGGWYNKVWDSKNCMNDKVVYEKTGLKNVKFTISASGAEEKLNAMIAANTLPDVITIDYGGNSEKIDLLQSGGLVEDLNVLMDKYSPTLKKEVPKSLIDWWKTDDGKWYAFPNYTYTGRAKSSGGTGIMSSARKDIMDQLGIKAEDFKTQDGFVAALKKVKDSGIKQDGVAMLPLIMCPVGPGNNQCAYHGQIFALKQEDKKGKFLLPVQAPEYWEYAKFLNRLYREGLFTEQNLLMQQKEGEEIALKGGFFAQMGWSGYDGPIANSVSNSNGKIYYAPIEFPRNSAGEDPIFTYGQLTSVWTVTFISKQAKNKDRIIRLFDYMFSKEGQKQLQFGTEGITWEKYKDGIVFTKKYNDELMADKPAAEKKYGLKQFWMLGDGDYCISLGYQRKYEEMDTLLKMQTDIWSNSGKYQLANDCIGEAVVNPDPGSEEADINTKITVYLDEQMIKAFTAKTESDFEALKTTTMDTITKYGLLKLQATMDAKYQAMKKKLGIKFSYPQNQK